MRNVLGGFAFILSQALASSAFAAQDCRSYHRSVMIDGVERLIPSGVACRNPDGSWEIQRPTNSPISSAQKQPDIRVIPTKPPSAVVAQQSDSTGQESKISIYDPDVRFITQAALSGLHPLPGIRTCCFSGNTRDFLVVDLPNAKSAFGWRVHGVKPDSYADRAGVQAGDIFYGIDNYAFPGGKEWLKYVMSQWPGNYQKTRVARPNEKGGYDIAVIPLPITAHGSDMSFETHRFFWKEALPAIQRGVMNDGGGSSSGGGSSCGSNISEYQCENMKTQHYMDHGY